MSQAELQAQLAKHAEMAAPEPEKPGDLSAVEVPEAVSPVEEKVVTESVEAGQPEDLWSLAPPTENKKVAVAEEEVASEEIVATEEVAVAHAEPVAEPREEYFAGDEKSTSIGVQEVASKNIEELPREEVAPEVFDEVGSGLYTKKTWTDSPIPWVASGLTLVVAIIFVIASFFGGEEPEDVAESEEVQEAIEQIAQTDPQEVEAKRELRRLQEKVKAMEDARKKEWRRQQQAQQNDSRSQSRDRPPVAAAPAAEPARSRSKSQEKRSAAKRKTAAKKKTSKRSGGRGARASGGHRGRSYYTQRDRKALFYAAFEAEKMVLDLESNYKKLRSDKAKWGTFYRKWKKNLRSSMPATIKNYPARGEKYGYPKQLASYLKDHDLLVTYGKLHNAKVMGTRIPASPGKNLQKVFSQYQAQAQSLGRP